MAELHTLEEVPSGEGNTDKELLNFWDRGNLKKIFEAEAQSNSEVYKKVKDIDLNYNADKDVLKINGLLLPQQRREKLGALDADRERKIREAMAPFYGRFLEKLWSALDYHIRDRSKEIARMSGKLPEIRPEAVARMDDFYRKIWSGLTPKAGDARATVPNMEEKIKLAEDMRSFGEIFIGKRNFAPAEIDRAAQGNEAYAIAELKKIKQSPPPDLGVSRKAGFNPDLDPEKMPPFSAAPILRDYSEHLKKFELNK